MFLCLGTQSRPFLSVSSVGVFATTAWVTRKSGRSPWMVLLACGWGREEPEEEAFACGIS